MAISFHYSAGCNLQYLTCHPERKKVKSVVCNELRVSLADCGHRGQGASQNPIRKKSQVNVTQRNGDWGNTTKKEKVRALSK